MTNENQFAILGKSFCPGYNYDERKTVRQSRKNREVTYVNPSYSSPSSE